MGPDRKGCWSLITALSVETSNSGYGRPEGRQRVTLLDKKFIDQAQRSSIEIDHGSHVARFEAPEPGAEVTTLGPAAELSVSVDGILVGFITSYTDDEHGVVSINDTDGAVPRTFRTVEGALEQLLPGAADGLATPALQQ
jgi:hypothetical protein